MKRVLFSLFVFAVITAAAGTAAAQGSFTGLGTRDTYVSGMSADGSVVVGVRSTAGPIFRWSGGKTENIGGVGGNPKVSRDGKVIVGDAKDSQGIVNAAIWQGGTTWRPLGGIPNGKSMDGTLSSAWGINGDGSVIVGLAWHSSGKSRAFRWDTQNGMVDLGSLQAQSSRANAVSADGAVVVGWDNNPMPSNYNSWRGACWYEEAERLMHPYGWIGQTEATNGTGTAMVGRGHPASYRHAYLYTASDGRIRDLGAIRRGLTAIQRDQENTSIAYGVSDDTTVVVGSSGWMPPLDAFIWVNGTGKMQKLTTYLTEAGITGFEGWQLVVANSVSPDGKILAGVGINPSGLVEGWIAKLP